MKQPEEPKLTSYQITEIQQEICHLMAVAGEEEDSKELERIDQEMDSLYEMLGEQAEDKLLGLRAVSKRIESEMEMLKREADVISKARKSHQRSLARVKTWATSLMRGLAETKGVTKLSVDGRTFWLARTWKLDGPKEPELWPEEGQRSTTRVEADRSAARKALEKGADVPDGFSWEQKEGIRWR